MTAAKVIQEMDGLPPNEQAKVKLFSMLSSLPAAGN